jgi:hypothetical protein
MAKSENQDPGGKTRRRISFESANLIGSPQDDVKIKRSVKSGWMNTFGLIRGSGLGDLLRDWAGAANPGLQAVHIEIDDGSGEESEHLADDQSSDDGDAERLAKFGAGAAADGEWNGAE